MLEKKDGVLKERLQVSYGIWYVSGKRMEISTALGQLQESEEVFGFGKRSKRNRAWSRECSLTPRDGCGQLSQPKLTETCETFKEFPAAWKITELSEIRPGNKSLFAMMHRTSQVICVLSHPVWRLFCLKVNYSNFIFLNFFLDVKSLQHLLENSL